MRLLKSPNDRVLAALATLSGNNDWEQVLEWLEVCQKDLVDKLTDYGAPESVFRVTQGAVLAIADVLGEARNAAVTIERRRKKRS